MEQTPRRWFKKKRFLIPIAVVAVLAFGGGESSLSSPQPIVPVQAVQKHAQPSVIEAKQRVSIPATAQNLSNDNYYTNVDGNRVHSPTYSDSVPAGASARCQDGTYSFSQNRRGTCSRHGGVFEWL